jgi:NDP-sugar pyrophosphorylase family protein
VNRWVIDRTAGQALDGYARVEDALCHHTARVHPGASLVGPVIVGPGATLDDDVVVIGPSAIGAHARLAPGAVVTRSVVWDRCVIESNAVVDTSVLVSGSVVAADRYLCGGLELPNGTYEWVPAAADDVSPLWRLPVLPHTPLRSSSAPSRTAADLERARLRA